MDSQFGLTDNNFIAEVTALKELEYLKLTKNHFILNLKILKDDLIEAFNNDIFKKKIREATSLFMCNIENTCDGEMIKEHFKNLISEERIFILAIQSKISINWKNMKIFEKFEEVSSLFTDKNLKTQLSYDSRLKLLAYFHYRGFDVKKFCTEDEKMKITELIKDFFQNDDDSLVQYLLSRSRYNQSFEEKLKIHYRNLTKIKDMKTLLKIVEDDLEIYIDAESNDVERLYLLCNKNDKGVFDPQLMSIYVGVKNDENSSDRNREIEGILIHEICHYAMFKIFNNDCKPYEERDEDEKSKFMKIFNNCHEMKINEQNVDIVDRVFDYDQEMQPAELIVRAPQMIVLGLDDIEEKYDDLLKYFREIVIERARNFIESRFNREIEEVSLFNFNLCEFEPIERSIKFSGEKSLHIIKTNVIDMSMKLLKMQFKNQPTIFTSKYEYEKLRSKILKICNRNPEVKLVIAWEDQNVNPDEFKCLKNVIVVCNENLSTKMECVQINFSFENLTNLSKSKFLKFEINFQGETTMLSNLFSENSNSLNYLPIEFILKKSNVKIGREIEMNEGYDERFFIHRFLLYKCEDSKNEKIISTEKLDELKEIMKNHKIILISDPAGHGKSTILTNLALNLRSYEEEIEDIFGTEFINKSRWIVKINLHKHIDDFKKGNLSDETLMDFMLKNFIQSKCENEIFEVFEKEAFKETLESSFFILDGFDEVAPFCDGKVKVFIKKLLNLNVENILIATRPHLEADFSNYGSKLKILHLQPFTETDQSNYLYNFLSTEESISQNVSDEKLKQFVDKSLLELIFTLYEEVQNNQIIYMTAIPLHIYMFGVVFQEEIIDKDFDVDAILRDRSIFKYFFLYDRFVIAMEKIALRSKGEKIFDELYEVSKEETCNLYENLAFSILFGKDFELIDSKLESIKRYGIVTKIDSEFNFIHRTFAEYFIAKAILNQLINGDYKDATRNEILIQILVDPSYVVVRTFIDDALSTNQVFKKISTQSMESLGNFLADYFMRCIYDNPHKHFVHFILESKKYKARGINPENILIFLSHLCLSSLHYANDLDIVKLILILPHFEFNVNNQGNQDPVDLSLSVPALTAALYDKIILRDSINYGKNLFHLTCHLDIKCLIEVVWELAKKVFKNEAKDFFMISTSPDLYSRGFNLNFETRISFFHLKLSSKYFKPIEELRDMKVNEKLDFNDDKNFDKSSVFYLLEIAKNLNLSYEEKMKLTQQRIIPTFAMFSERIFYELNVIFKIKKDLFSDKFYYDRNYKDNYCDRIHSYIRHVIEWSNDTNHIQKVFNFLKMKMSDEEYKATLHYFFTSTMEGSFTDGIFPNVKFENIKKMHSILESDLSERELDGFYSNYPFLHCYSVGIKEAISFYTLFLSDSQIKLFMLNKSVNGKNTLLNRIIYFSDEIALHTLSELKSKLSKNEEILYEILNNSFIFSITSSTPEKFEIILNFYGENFDFKKLSFEEIRRSVIISHKISLVKILNILEEIYTLKDWEKLVFILDENKDTQLHNLMYRDDYEKFENLNKIIKSKFDDQNYEKLLSMKNNRNQTVNDLMKLRNRK